MKMKCGCGLGQYAQAKFIPYNYGSVMPPLKPREETIYGVPDCPCAIDNPRQDTLYGVPDRIEDNTAAWYPINKTSMSAVEAGNDFVLDGAEPMEASLVFSKEGTLTQMERDALRAVFASEINTQVGEVPLTYWEAGPTGATWETWILNGVFRLGTVCPGLTASNAFGGACTEMSSIRSAVKSLAESGGVLLHGFKIRQFSKEVIVADELGDVSVDQDNACQALCGGMTQPCYDDCVTGTTEAVGNYVQQTQGMQTSALDSTVAGLLLFGGLTVAGVITFIEIQRRRK